MSEITVGGLSSLILVEKTERYENQNIVVQVIKNKPSNNPNSLEIHLSDKEHIFVGIVKANDPALLPAFSIVKIKDFTINYPKRFLSILDFQVLDKSHNEILISGRQLTYHPVYRKQQDQNQQQQQQQQQQHFNNNNNNNNNQQQQQQQKVFKPNMTPTKNLPIPKSTQGTRQPQSSSTSQNYNRPTIDPESLRNQPITEIGDINNTIQKPTIKAIVMTRMPIKEWNKGENSGRLFSVILQDNSSQIKATCFTSTNSQLSNFDELYSQFEEKKVLLISNFQIKATNPEYNKLGHAFEININSSSAILPVEEEIQVPYSFTPIANLQSESGFHDVIGVITDCQLKQEVISKAGNRLTKSTFTIKDTTGAIEVIFWNEKANIEANIGDVLLVKSAKLNDFNNNKTLSASFCEINNFTYSEAAQLRQQNDTNSLFSGQSLSRNYNPSSNYANIDLPLYVLKTLPESSPLYRADQKKDSQDKIQYRVVGHLSRIPPYIRNSVNDHSDELSEKKYLDWYYEACTKCKKSSNSHQGVPCDGTDYEKNYKMTFKLADESENINVDIIGASGYKLLGVTANELAGYNQDDINKLFSSVLGQLYEITLQISTYNREDTNTVYRRYTATSIQKVDTNSFIRIIDDSFNQCRLFNKD